MGGVETVRRKVHLEAHQRAVISFQLVAHIHERVAQFPRFFWRQRTVMRALGRTSAGVAERGRARRRTRGHAPVPEAL